MALVTSEGNVPPGAFAMHDHLIRVLDRVLRGSSYRGEVVELLEAAEKFDKWRKDKGCELSFSAGAIRNRSLDLLHRLAATLPEYPARAADAEGDIANSTETLTVEAFAHAIGKSPRTVYRMAHQGQLFMYREGVGRGTLLIYRDQVDPANRPKLAPTAKGLPQASPWNAAPGRQSEPTEALARPAVKAASLARP